MCQTCGCTPIPGLEESDREGHDHKHHGESHSHGGDSHGHSDSRMIQLQANLLEKNDALAAENREWLATRKVLAINLVSSPGSGKTTLLERTIRGLAGKVSISVIEGDQATERDAERIRAAGARAVQVNTGAGCHLDAHMVTHALRELDPPPGSLLAIENVGNLVCPALFDLGERLKVIVASVTEGDDKPEKYPHMFRAGGLVLLNKVDLLPHLSFDPQRFTAMAQRTNPELPILPISATAGDGLDAWYSWLQGQMAA